MLRGVYGGKDRIVSLTLQLVYSYQWVFFGIKGREYPYITTNEDSEE